MNSAFLERMRLWVEAHRHDVVLYVLFFLVSIISFSLGYILAGQAERATITINQVEMK